MAKKEEKTNAIRALTQKKVDFKVHSYMDTDAISGLEVVEALGENPDMVFKTLVTVGKSGNHYVFLVPVNKELDLKKGARSVSEKNIEMIKSKELLGLTGYVHGGCSPIGMKKAFKTTIDVSAKEQEKIFFSGGKIGLQIETTLAQLEKVLDFELNDITK